MHTASCLLSLFCLLGALPAQQDPPRPAVVVTQQEQNALRAAAFKAEVEGRFGAAATAFRRLYDASPTRLDWCIATARCLGRSGQFGAAMDLLEVARKRFEGDLEIEAMLARTLILQTESKDGIVHPEILWADAAAQPAALSADAAAVQTVAAEGQDEEGPEDGADEDEVLTDLIILLMAIKSNSPNQR